MTTLSSTERGEHTPGIVERLRDKDARWQARCDAWIAEARQLGPVDPEAEAVMRATWEAEAADLISELVGALEGVLFIHELTSARVRTERIEAAWAAITKAKARGGAE